MASLIPTDRHITYQLQFRKCGKARCRKCRQRNEGHGPYWYAFWHTNEGRLRSGYIGKNPPPGVSESATEEAQPTQVQMCAPSFMLVLACASA